MEKDKSERLSYIDVARGFVIILMLIGHANAPVPLVKAIFGFHMPFFFILSGFLYNKEKWSKLGFKNLIVTKFKSYIVPYFILAFFNLLINIPLEQIRGLSGQELFNSTINHLQWIFYSWGSIDKMPNCTPLWFLPCMFICCICFYLLNKIKSAEIQTAICLLSVILDYILYLTVKIQLPWHINIALIGTVFMFIGLKIKENNTLEKINHGVSFVVSMVALGALCIVTNPRVDLCNNTLNNTFLTFLGSITVSSAILFICYKYVNNFKFLAFLGKNTIIIMALNYAVNSYSNQIWSNTPVLQNISYCWWIMTIVDILVCSGFILLWCKLKKFFPVLKHLHI